MPKAKKFDSHIRHRIFIKKSPDKVYDTITSGSEWNAFFTHSTEVAPEPNGRIVFRWKDWGPDFYSVEADGKVVTADRPDEFAFEWYPVGRENPTRVAFKLEPKYGGTIITLTEDGYLDTKEGRDMILECACGWGEALTLLKFYLEHGVTYTPPEKD
jgi:uncharacterized protein YndB with AHSA1/START domain